MRGDHTIALLVVLALVLFYFGGLLLSVTSGIGWAALGYALCGSGGGVLGAAVNLRDRS